VRYRLDLTVIPSEPGFHGTARIDLRLDQRTDFLWLNGKDLEVESAQLEWNGSAVPVRVAPSGGEFLGFAFPHDVGPGPASLTVTYRGRLSEKLNVGAYRREEDGRWYVFTTFTAIDARRAFPCFDEPEYKTPWDLTLHVPRGDVALGNAREVSRTEEAGGMKKVVFAPTLPLPTEVVAFAVGPFDIVDAGFAGMRHVPIRIITPHGRAVEATYAKTITAGLMARLEAYTGMPYPWDKLDHIALMQGAYGAVENPGLITYQERTLLARPDRDTLERQRALRATMAHEMSHQWFGDMVTQAWWNDTWLSEGFATWLSAKIMDEDLPPVDRGLADVESRARMMDADAGSNSVPVRASFASRDDMRHVYNRTVYVKGAVVLAMIEQWLGPDAFQRGLHRYLEDHRFKNASARDLAADLREETGVDVWPVMSSFLNQTGVPTVQAELKCSAGGAPALSLTQHTFAALGVSEPARQWSVPVCVRWPDGGRRCAVDSSPEMSMPLQATGCPAWVWIDAGGQGYYHARLSAGALASLMKSGYAQLTPPERLTLAEDVKALVEGGELPAAQALEILPRLARDPEPRVAMTALRCAVDLSAAAPDSLRAQYDAFLRRLLADWRRGGTVARPDLLRQAQGASLDQFFKGK
jgi:aminopeptidase N